MGQAINHNGRQNGNRRYARSLTYARSEEVAAGERGTFTRASATATPREVLMGARLRRLFLGGLISVSLSAAWVEASDIEFTIVPAGEAAMVSPVAGSAESGAKGIPWIHSKMRPKVEKKIRSGFLLAEQRIREIPECRELFDDLGADGIEALRETLYFPASAYRETTLCKRAVAVTHVGAAPTVVCSHIARYKDEEAAKVLIHEALHHAGLTEAPQDPDAMSSRVINQMVKKKCEL
jgi:hypothetical protein